MTLNPPYNTNTVKSFTPNQSNARNLSPERELTQSWRVVTIHKRQIVTVAALNWYEGRSRNASVVYCSAWFYPTPSFMSRYPNTYHPSGYGSAGGGGYDKYSAAADSAVNSAGFTLTHRFDGCGEYAIRSALTAIARRIGYRGPLTFLT